MQLFIQLLTKSNALSRFISKDDGQDLVEYAAVISLVVLGITAGMTTLANGINDAMGSVGTSINNVIG